MADPSADYRKVDVKRVRRFGLLEKKGLSGYLFILPFLIGFFVILLPTVAQSFWYMFHDVKIEFGGVAMEWIGLENFRVAFFEDAAFVPMMMIVAMTIVPDIIIVICFSFFISNVLNQKFLGRGAARMVFFLPVLLTTGIVTMMAEANEALDYGVEASATGFDTLGLGAFFSTSSLMNTLGIPSDDLPIIGFNVRSFILRALMSISSIINESGVQILIFLSALQSISPSLFEAAKVEGATKWEEFWKITFPMLTPMILVAIVYSIINTFTNPRFGIMNTLHQASFGAGTHGYGSALAWLYFLMIMIFLGLTWLLIARRVSYLE
jgi:ABC-type sugar transport system permease subunit